MPSYKAVLVKPNTGKGEGNVGLAVLVPMDAASAADVGSEAAEGYKGTDGKPLLTRNLTRAQMAAHLKTIEELDYEGNKHKDVQSGKIADAAEEAKRLRKLLDDSYKIGALPDGSHGTHGIVGTSSWSCDEARLAATNSHKEVASKCFADLQKKPDSSTAEEMLRIASSTKHASVALDAVIAAIEKDASKEALMTAAGEIGHSEAALMAFQAAKGQLKAK